MPKLDLSCSSQTIFIYFSAIFPIFLVSIGLSRKTKLRGKEEKSSGGIITCRNNNSSDQPSFSFNLLRSPISYYSLSGLFCFLNFQEDFAVTIRLTSRGPCRSCQLFPIFHLSYLINFRGLLLDPVTGTVSVRHQYIDTRIIEESYKEMLSGGTLITLQNPLGCSSNSKPAAGHMYFHYKLFYSCVSMSATTIRINKHVNNSGQSIQQYSSAAHQGHIFFFSSFLIQVLQISLSQYLHSM